MRKNLERLVIGQNWTESERGWGTRPDGYTLHFAESCRLAFIKEYWDGMPDEVPDEYSRSEGEPFVVRIDEEHYQALDKDKREGGNGIWGAYNGRIPKEMIDEEETCLFSQRNTPYRRGRYLTWKKQIRTQT